jgi:hypothetical protein
VGSRIAGALRGIRTHAAVAHVCRVTRVTAERNAREYARRLLSSSPRVSLVSPSDAATLRECVRGACCMWPNDDDDDVPCHRRRRRHRRHRRHRRNAESPRKLRPERYLIVRHVSVLPSASSLTSSTTFYGLRDRFLGDSYTRCLRHALSASFHFHFRPLVFSSPDSRRIVPVPDIHPIPPLPRIITTWTVRLYLSQLCIHFHEPCIHINLTI